MGQATTDDAEIHTHFLPSLDLNHLTISALKSQQFGEERGKTLFVSTDN